MLFQSWKTKYQCSESLHSQKNSVFFILIFFSQTITKVLLKYCALLSKIFPFYCEKEKIVSTAALIFWFWVPDWFEKKKKNMHGFVGVYQLWRADQYFKLPISVILDLFHHCFVSVFILLEIVDSLCIFCIFCNSSTTTEVLDQYQGYSAK